MEYRTNFLQASSANQRNASDLDTFHTDITMTPIRLDGSTSESNEANYEAAAIGPKDLLWCP